LWALRQAGLAPSVSWEDGIGFIAPARLPRVSEPLPGDILVVPQPFQHQAIVASYDPATGMITTVDGNQPGINPRVRFRNSNTEFYSIQPLIDEAERRMPWGYLVAGAALAGAAAWVWLHGLPAPVERTLRRLGA